MHDAPVIVRLYGRLGELIGPEVTLRTAEGCTVADVRRALSEEYQSASSALSASRVRACVGESIVPDDRRVTAGEVVEFFPPVSGG